LKIGQACCGPELRAVLSSCCTGSCETATLCDRQARLGVISQQPQLEKLDEARQAAAMPKLQKSFGFYKNNDVSKGIASAISIQMVTNTSL